MVAYDEAGGRSSRGRVFTAADFRVPAHYLPLLVGEAEAMALTGGPPADGVLPSMRFLNLCLEQMRRSGDEACGVSATPVVTGTFGLMLAAASQGDTFADALKRFADAARMLRPDMVVRFSRTRRALELSVGYEGPRSGRRDLLTEIFAITVHCGLRWLTGRTLAPVFLRVQPGTPPMGPTLLRPVISPIALRRGTGVTIGYDLADGRAPLRPVKYKHWAAHELGEFTTLLEAAARQMTATVVPAVPELVARVRSLIGPKAWTEPDVARALGMSVATLRRRLSEAGVSFRTLSSEARRDAAASLLVTGRALEDVAAELGFSDARSLRRACHGWFGMAPGEYRRHRLDSD